MARLLRQGFRAGAPTTLSPTESASKSQGRFVTLDGMRGVSAALVVWFHMSQSGWVPMFGLPFLAVDLFFGLSGFVLAIAYDQRNLDFHSSFNQWKAAISRDRQ